MASTRGFGSSSSIRRTMPSIRPAKPKMKPELIAARVERPIASCGSSRSIREIRAARSIRAVSEGARPGPDRAAQVLAVGGDDVDVDPGAEVDRYAGRPEALVGGDRVDEAVGPDLERVLDPDRHPGLHAGADRQALGFEIALGELLELTAERRHDRGDADGVDIAEGHPAEREEAGDPLGQLVAGRARAGLEAPVLDQVLALEGAQVGLRVSDVDGEQHRRIIAAGDWPRGQVGAGPHRIDPDERPPLHHPRLAPIDRRGADARAQGHRLQADRPAAGDLQGRPARSRLSGPDGAGAEDRRTTRSRARARSPASWSACDPSRRSSPPTRPSGRRSKRPSASATRSCSTRSARSSGGRSSATRRRCAATPRAPRSACRSGWR